MPCRHEQGKAAAAMQERANGSPYLSLVKEISHPFPSSPTGFGQRMDGETGNQRGRELVLLVGEMCVAIRAG
jgi:hypothetical protein